MYLLQAITKEPLIVLNKDARHGRQYVVRRYAEALNCQTYNSDSQGWVDSNYKVNPKVEIKPT